MRAFNQLSLSDDTKGGFFLVAFYVLVDTYVYPQLGRTLQLILGREVGMENLWGGLEIGLVLVVAWLLVRANARKLRRHTEVARLADLDPRFAKAIAEMTEPRDRGAEILVMKDLRSTDAFCATTETGRPCVILGGGLRLLFRRHPERALAVVAHEQAHIQAGDNKRVLFAWHLFLAYAAVTLSLFLAQQILFAGRFVVMTWHYDRQALFSTLGVNWVHAYRAGFPKVLALLPVYIALVQLMQMREYFADERAAQAGLRRPLEECLEAQVGSDAPRQRWRPFRFHPPLEARVRRLQNPEAWCRVDLAYVAALAFFTSRLALSWQGLPGVQSHADAVEAANPQLDNVERLLASLSDVGEWVRTFSALPLLFLGAWLLAHHLYRTACSTICRRGEKLRLRELGCLLAAYAAGGFLGKIGAGSFIYWLSTVSVSEAASGGKSYLHEVIGDTGLACSYLAVVFLMAYFGVRQPDRRARGRLAGWTAAWLGLSALFSGICSVSFVLGMRLAGRDYYSWFRQADPERWPDLRLMLGVLLGSGAVGAGLIVISVNARVRRAGGRAGRVDPSREIELAVSPPPIPAAGALAPVG